MKLALVAIVFALSGAAPHAPVLGFDYGEKRISWYDPATLASVKGSALAWDGQLCSWSFSPDRKRLAVSDCNGKLSFFALPSLKSLGKVQSSSRIWDASSLTWVTPTRLLAVDRAGGGVSSLLVIDTEKRRLIRRVDLGGVVNARALAGNRLAFLVVPFDSFGPARVVVARADGTTRSATIDAITAGSHFGPFEGAGPTGEVRTPGFAVDPSGTAYVVGAELKVAAVDLTTMGVTYRGPTRSLAKALTGTTRTAEWLGGGKIAVSGSDFAADTSTPARPFGLHVLDTSTWTYTTLDATASGFVADGSTILAYASARWSAYSTAGAHLYDIVAPAGSSVTPAQGYTYVCTDRWLTRVLDSATGAQLAAPKNRGCPTHLAGRAAQY
ncbi:MAG: hypothetical protein QOF43_103 [Gaiellaceae bacterium]|nr:hypothetical protein [Gaiellaceae bacterium]